MIYYSQEIKCQGKRNWSIVFYCNLNIHRSIANQCHLNNFRNNSQRKTLLFSWTATSRLPCFSLPRINAVFSDHIPCTHNHVVERSVFAILLAKGHQGWLPGMLFMYFFIVMHPPTSSEAVMCVFLFRLAIWFQHAF